MRKFLSSRSLAQFHKSTPRYTLRILKDCVEIIFKIKKGVYVIINMVVEDNQSLSLFSNWGTFFHRITNPHKQLNLLSKSCPVLYSILSGHDTDGIVEVKAFSNVKDEIGFSIRNIAMCGKVNFIESFDHYICEKAFILANKSLAIYNEIQHQCPFQTWRDALEDLWD